MPTFEDVRAAARRLAGVAHRTPVITSTTLDARAGCAVFLKCENFQRMGAFKFRGAYNTLASLDEATRARGVVAFSSGNHAQGIALAAKLLGVKATIVMPSDAPASKVSATRGYGAEIVFYERTTQDRNAIAAEIAGATGATIVSPFDHEQIIAGAGTAALELLEEVGPLDAILTPVGGGGLLSGTAIAARGVQPSIDIWGVEPETGDDFARSLAAGERIKIAVPATIADGLQTQSPGELTFPIVRELTRGVVTVSDAQLAAAMRFAFERLKVVIEPSGCAPLAALLFEKIPQRYERVGIVISGGNVDADRYGALIAE